MYIQSNMNNILRAIGKKNTKRIKTENLCVKAEENENKNDDVDEAEDISNYKAFKNFKAIKGKTISKKKPKETHNKGI